MTAAQPGEPDRAATEPNRWARPLTAYEQSLVARLLAADGAPSELPGWEVGDILAIQIDRCGCLALHLPDRSMDWEGADTAVACGTGPEDAHGLPIEVVLTLRGGIPRWLELRRNGGEQDFHPQPEALRVTWTISGAEGESS